MKTHVEGCELHPIVFQVFDRETEIRIEGVCHCLQVDTARERRHGQNVLDVKQAELLRICGRDRSMGGPIYPSHI